MLFFQTQIQFLGTEQGKSRRSRGWKVGKEVEDEEEMEEDARKEGKEAEEGKKLEGRRVEEKKKGTRTIL